MKERDYYLGFSVFPGIGPKRFHILLDYFGSAEKAWKADSVTLETPLGKIMRDKFIDFRSHFDLPGYRRELDKKNVAFFAQVDTEYPRLLKQINNPPFLLYIKGNHNALNYSKSIGIVGTRKITEYGKEVTATITESLVKNGYTIISGLAFGVDACAHAITVENKGVTVAVLGCGVDCCSPRENYQLYKRIIDSGGCIVSENPLNAAPTKGSFPSRNRIIAGLSDAVIVTEGTEDSGALYTAYDALASARPVFAVPGPITSQLSKGPLSLVAKGATLVTSIEDILKELKAKNVLPLKKRERKVDSKDEQMILDILENQELLFDDIVRKTGIQASKLGILLSLMEMKGIIKRLAAGAYMLED